MGKTWHQINKDFMVASMDSIRQMLKHKIEYLKGNNKMQAMKKTQIHTKETVPGENPPKSALDLLSTAFGLSEFEKNILLLCAGIELEGDFPGLCAKIHGDEKRTYPTFSLALSCLPAPHWSAITPDAPLREWQFVDVDTVSGTVAHSPLRIEESVLHYLLGIPQIDMRLKGMAEPVKKEKNIVPSHKKIADQIVKSLTAAREKSGKMPVVQLCGTDSSAKKGVGSEVCSMLGLQLYRMPFQLLPTDPKSLDRMIRLWSREAVLNLRVLMVECDDITMSDTIAKTSLRLFMERSRGIVLLSAMERMSVQHRSVIAFDIQKPSGEEQKKIWQNFMGEKATGLNNNNVDNLISQFDLGTNDIRSAWAGVMSVTDIEPDMEKLWSSCRIQARPQMDDLAQRMKTLARWDDIVLPKTIMDILQEIAAQVRQRYKVYNQWGFAAKFSRGLGISALFAGQSGTGKTMAAEVLASELKLDLYRIDLSAVVSKYIGETEKHLRRIFDAAETGGAILLFDEADALFGQRSEVKDSHDRHANIEVSYLLQRMEDYQGLAVLTTNMKDALDSAFMRRIRFIVDFPFSEAKQREKIWQRIFPDDTPTQDIDTTSLAQLNVSGGHIKNIALNAAFIAANKKNNAVTMEHLLQASMSEYVKMERTLTQTEIEGWV